MYTGPAMHLSLTAAGALSETSMEQPSARLSSLRATASPATSPIAAKSSAVTARTLASRRHDRRFFFLQPREMVTSFASRSSLELRTFISNKFDRKSSHYSRTECTIKQQCSLQNAVSLFLNFQPARVSRSENTVSITNR